MVTPELAFLLVQEHSGHRSFEVTRELVAAVAQSDAARCNEILQLGSRIGRPRDDIAMINDPTSRLRGSMKGGFQKLWFVGFLCVCLGPTESQLLQACKGHASWNNRVCCTGDLADVDLEIVISGHRIFPTV